MITDPAFYVDEVLSRGGMRDGEYEMDLVDMVQLHFQPLDCLQKNGEVQLQALQLLPRKQRPSLMLKVITWSRLVVIFRIKHPHVYHRVVDSFACNKQKDPQCFEASGELYGEYLHGMPVPSPPGYISRSLTNQLRDLC